MITSIIKSEVVKREISGKLWMDANKNGKQDTGEVYIPGMKLKLVDTLGNDVFDIYGNKVEALVTNSYGAYVFTNLKAGKYKIVVVDEQNKNTITIKQAQSVPEDLNSDGEIERSQIVIKEIILEEIQENIFDYKKEHLDIGFIEIATQIQIPTKSVVQNAVDINKETVMPGEEFEYEIKQKVNKLNHDIFAKYSVFKITDKLPEEVEYVSSQIELNGLKMNVGKLSYDKDTHTITFDGNETFLSAMQMNEEIYTLRIKVKAKQTLTKTDIIKNKGTTNINNNIKETNEVENPVKDAEMKTPIKDVVINDISIHEQQVMPGQEFEYVIHQQVNQLNHDIYAKYHTFKIIDKLPEEVEYVSSQIERNGAKLNAQVLSYSRDINTVTFDANDRFLNEMERNQEIYTLRIKVKAKETLRSTNVIRNTASTNIDDKEQITNEVINDIKDPIIKSPTKMNYDEQGNEINKKEVYPGDTIIYEINQKVNKEKQDIYTKYNKFILSDKLDSKVTYQKAELLKNNQVIEVEGITYNKELHTVTFTGNDTFLKEMEMNDETYTLRIYTKVNREIKENDIITNIATSKVQDSDKDTNEVTNKIVVPKGKIEFLKLTKQLVGIEEQELKYASLPQPDVTYELFAKEDIKYGNGTLIYPKGTSFEAKTTDETGTITFDNLYEGIYELKEIAAPSGIILNDVSIEIKIEATEDGQQQILVESEYENKAQEVQIFGTKKFETDNDNEFESSAGATFGIYHAKDYEIKQDNIIPRDTLVAQMQTDENGRFTYQGRLIPGQIYYIKEITTKDGYLLDNQIRYFKYEATTNEEIHVIEIFENGYIENGINVAYLEYQEETEGVEGTPEEIEQQENIQNLEDIKNIKVRTEEFTKNIINKNGNRIKETIAEGKETVTFELKASLPNDKDIKSLKIIDKLEPVFKLQESTVRIICEEKDITKEGTLDTNINQIIWNPEDANKWKAKEIIITFDVIIDEVSYANYEFDGEYFKIPNKARVEIDEIALEDKVHVKVREKKPVNLPFTGLIKQIKENKNTIYLIGIITAIGMSIVFGYQYYKKEKD